MACAWATLLCYASMMVLSYIWGQRAYPVPYATKKLVAFFGLMLVFYFMYRGICLLTPLVWVHLPAGAGLLFLYLRFIFSVEKKEMSRLPVVGKWCAVTGDVKITTKDTKMNH